MKTLGGKIKILLFGIIIKLSLTTNILAFKLYASYLVGANKELIKSFDDVCFVFIF
jgi:hypothetical protein